MGASLQPGHHADFRHHRRASHQRFSARRPAVAESLLPLLRRVAELQSRGGGIVSIYNEEVVIAALVKFGYPEKRRAI
ncbi:MAG: hypothetical protein V8T86_15715 [Victivallis sp.]